MSLLRKIFVSFVLICLTACGFRPLYVGKGTNDSISGKQLTEDMAAVFIDEIPDRTGQILHRFLIDGITPRGETKNPRYRLSVRLSPPVISQQAVRQDNLATRYLMSFTAYYTLYSYPENRKLLSDSTVGRSGYDVQLSPYATDVAEEAAKKRIMKILGEDITLRLAAFLKTYDVSEKSKQ